MPKGSYGSGYLATRGRTGDKYTSKAHFKGHMNRMGKYTAGSTRAPAFVINKSTGGKTNLSDYKIIETRRIAANHRYKKTKHSGGR